MEKVYVCSSVDGYMPLYDPDGSFYKKGPQFGCLEKHKSLNNRYILLDRYSPENILSELNKLPFNAKFIEKNTFNSKTNATIITDGFMFDINPLFSSSLAQDKKQSFEKTWYIQVLFYIGSSASIDSIKNHTMSLKRDSGGRYYTNMYNFKNIYNNGTNIQKIKLTKERRSIWFLNKYRFIQSHKNGGKFDFNEPIANSSNSTILKIIIPIVVFILLIFLSSVTLFLYKKNRHISKDIKTPPFPVHTGSSNSTNSTNSTIVIVASSKTDYNQRNGNIQTKLLKTDPYNDDSNCTLQTVISSATSSTNSNTIGNDSCYGFNNSQLTNNDRKLRNESPRMSKSEKFKTFLRKIYTSVPTESAEAEDESSENTNNFQVKRFNTIGHTNKCGSNYLYFNYNNNTNTSDLNFNNEIAKIHSSTRSLVNTNTNHQKRLSGTEV